MNYKNEQTILKIIKFTPPIFIISMSIFLIIFLYFEYKTTYLQEKQLMEKEFVKYNKKIIKNNVETVYNTILEMQRNTESELKKSIKERVYEAKKIATRIYNENKDSKDKEAITKMIKDALVDIRFNEGRGYYYIYSMDYECILFPLNREIEGKNFYNFKDGNGKYLTRDIITQLKQTNEGFLSWYFYKPSDKNNNYRKIGFNVYFEPLDWFIGTGEYLDEFEEGIKEKALSYIKTLKYLNNNYIFVLDYDGTYLNHIKKEVIGTNGIKPRGTPDVKNSFDVVSKAINIAKNQGEGYLSYIQNNKPTSGKPTTKTSFVKGIQNWEWFIGQGFYEDDYEIALEEKRVILEEKFKTYVKNIFIISILLMIILLFVSKYVSMILQKKFKDYKIEIEEFVKENNHQRDVLAHQSKMSAMGEMIGNIAHQWRQPLSVITTAASGVKLNKELGISNDTDIDTSMDVIVEQSMYLSHIIEDFKDFLKDNKEKTCFKIERVVEKAINLAYGQFENSGIRIIKNIDEIEMQSAENQFVQALINIFKNASDEFEKINEKDKLLIICAKIKNSEIYFTIQDNAGGIPEDILPRIFEPYFTTKHQYQGTGMGLFMSEEIFTKVMNGKITVSNEVFKYEGKDYKGAKFEIILPLEDKI
ncbi:MAG: histidine kinase [Arcobacter sp.]|uniref:sensor histidine kinase n=1 Tax=uncultured Arcobacter sp. TaxID=165434 RepID=UPI000CCB4B73|nr:cache domain-containing protein [uncultured Arcobacter sp.]PLY09172.1 MAG: histidine kinase [Arcobacter sp.]